ncbi:MAG: T9SS type A sorting domain-containing protein [Saprospiraceae bacterium]|nr:T9SS type A sorting domain-containing protein [Candidatus Opimibacter skivensis]
MMKSFCLTLSLLCSFHLCTNAQSGYLDLSYSDDGIFTADLGGNGFDIVYNSTLQTDGKLVLTGISNGDFAIMRLLPDGTPDPLFGNDGLSLVDYAGNSDRSHAVVVQPDGRIVIAGETQINNQGDFAILRILPDGTPDSTFGIHGWTVTDLGTQYEFPNCVALQTDGKIVAAGRRTGTPLSDMVMVRYHPDGRVDSLFGSDGIVVTNLREEDEAFSIAIQPDGQIILAGFASISASGDFAVTRYNPDGTLDKFFGEGGKVITDIDGVNASDFIKAMVLLPDGKILVAGNANNSYFDGQADVGMVRYDQNGILDPEFGVGGIKVTSFGAFTNSHGLAVQPDGKILFGGISNAINEDKRWLLARFQSNGSLDEGFGAGGFTTTKVPGNNDYATAVHIQSDSRIILTGMSGGNPDIDFAAARYIADFILTPTITGITCPGTDDGSITIDASGGVAPYGYSIDGITFQSENTFTGLAAGTYTITIRDSNGPGTLGSIGPIVISEPVIPEVDITIIENDITIIVGSGGTTPYQYSIDGGDTFTSTNTFTDLNDGAYFILVLDGNGCQVIYRVVLIDITATHDPVESVAFTISPNPTNGQVRLEMNNTTGEPLQMRIMDMTGRVVFSSTISETGQVIRKYDLKDLDSGFYQVWVGNEKIRGTKKVVIAR